MSSKWLDFWTQVPYLLMANEPSPQPKTKPIDDTYFDDTWYEQFPDLVAWVKENKNMSNLVQVRETNDRQGWNVFVGEQFKCWFATRCAALNYALAMSNDQINAYEKGNLPQAGWYVSSVAQWIPEYFTEKPMNYDGPFETWQKALEFLFKEIGEDTDVLESENKALQFAINKLETLVPDTKPRDDGKDLYQHGYDCAMWDIGYTVKPLSTRKTEVKDGSL